MRKQGPRSDHNRMRILHIVGGFFIEGASGGITRFALNLVRAFDPELVEPVVCGMWDYGMPIEKERVKELNAAGISTFTAAPWKEEAPYQSFWRSVRAIRSFLQQNPVDILHSHTEFGDGAALILRLSPGSPNAMRTVHNHFVWKKRPLRRIYLTNLLYPLLLRAEVGVSQDIVNILDQRPLAKLLNRKAVKIFNSIDMNSFSPVEIDKAKKKQSLNIPPDAVVIGSVGRIVEQKGYVYLVEAANLMIREDPRVYFLIVGTGALEDEVRGQVKNCGLEGRVLLTGARNDIPELLAIMDIFVSSSLWEGFPTVLLESMLAHVPIVATDVPGTAEMIKNRVNGLLVLSKDPVALVGAIRELLDTPELRKNLISAAARSVNNYSIDVAARQYESLYASLLNR